MNTPLIELSKYAQAEINLQLDAEEKISLMREMIRIRRISTTRFRSHESKDQGSRIKDQRSSGCLNSYLIRKED